MSYPTTANLKTYIKTASSAEDTLLGWVNDAAIRFVEAWCGHDFVADADQTIYVMPEYPNLLAGRRVLLVRGYDIISVTSITNGDGESVDSGDYRLLPLDGPPYYKIELDADSGLFWWRGSDGAGVVTIVASSLGYSASCPADVFLAILDLGAYLYRARSSGGLGPVSTATRQGMVIPPDEVPPHILQMLAPYRRVR